MDTFELDRWCDDGGGMINITTNLKVSKRRAATTHEEKLRRNKERYWANVEKYRARLKHHYWANVEKYRARYRHPTRNEQRRARYAADVAYREREKTRKVKWRLENREHTRRYDKLKPIKRIVAYEFGVEQGLIPKNLALNKSEKVKLGSLIKEQMEILQCKPI